MFELLPQLRDGVESSQFLPIAALFALLLGWSIYTDIFREKTIKNLASLGMLFAAFAAFPFIFADPLEHATWAGAISVFLLFIWWIGAIADGDLKIYLAYAFLLGPLAIPCIFLSWIIIIIYSLPLMRKSIGQSKPKGERLGVAAAAPGIAFSLPLTIALFVSPFFGLFLMVAILAGTGLGYLAYRLSAN